MRRFAIFATVLLAVVIAGSQPWKASPKKSWCVCLPSRAGLILKSFTHSASTNTATVTRTATQRSATGTATVSSPAKTSL